jgi:hypothetical protein
MKPLYDESQFQKATAFEKLPLQCLNCKKTFYYQKCQIQASIAGRAHSKKTGSFCSNRCRWDFQYPPLSVPCDQCGKTITRRGHRIRRQKHHFCNSACNGKYGNAHKKHGSRVSKLERWIQEQLILLFPELEFHFNRRDTIKAELDVYIPSMKLAFELNGIFHYEPIFGPKQFHALQDNDKRKFQACIEKRIGFCVIDTSHQKAFKPETSKKYLDIIVGIINDKMKTKQSDNGHHQNETRSNPSGD